jgi:hypothetical protein
MVGNICNETQVYTHVHRLWGSLLYILWFYSHASRIFIVFDVSEIIFVLKISYINPLKEIVINYKMGRLKVHLLSCVVLVINDNPYGLIFSLS